MKGKWKSYTKRKEKIRAVVLTEHMESATGIGNLYGDKGDYYVNWGDGTKGIVHKIEFERIYEPIKEVKE